jgi:hypothetical protein
MVKLVAHLGTMFPSSNTRTNNAKAHLPKWASKLAASTNQPYPQTPILSHDESCFFNGAL